MEKLSKKQKLIIIRALDELFNVRELEGESFLSVPNKELDDWAKKEIKTFTKELKEIGQLMKTFVESDKSITWYRS